DVLTFLVRPLSRPRNHELWASARIQRRRDRPGGRLPSTRASGDGNRHLYHRRRARTQRQYGKYRRDPPRRNPTNERRDRRAPLRIQRFKERSRAPGAALDHARGPAFTAVLGAEKFFAGRPLRQIAANCRARRKECERWFIPSGFCEGPCADSSGRNHLYVAPRARPVHYTQVGRRTPRLHLRHRRQPETQRRNARTRRSGSRNQRARIATFRRAWTGRNRCGFSSPRPAVSTHEKSLRRATNFKRPPGSILEWWTAEP